MALSANTDIIQILEDSPDSATVLLMHHTTTASQETDALKINVATLEGRVLTLVTSNVTPGQADFIPGETVTADPSGAEGYVLSWTPSSLTANGSLVVGIVSGAFANGDTVTGARYGAEVEVVDTVVPDYTMHITGAWWTLSPGARVELEWKGNTVFSTALLLMSETGSLSKNQMESTTILNRAESPRDGNLYLTTLGLTANSGYSILLELRKGEGFASRPGY